jgi:uncharacterized membrane protein
MTLRTLLLLYLTSAAVFFAIDLLWLGAVAKDFYDRNLAGLLRERVNWAAAVLFYLVYIAGIQVFALVPAVTSGGAAQAFLRGALFGFFCYATFDLTNLALIRDWPVRVVLVDIVWGTVLTGAVSGLSFLLARRFLLS